MQKELEKVTRDATKEENLAKERNLLMEVEKLLEREEMYWALRSRVGWLRVGDRNTDFFHNYASSRRSKNRIKKLPDESGVWREDTTKLNPFISDYFAGLFSREIDEPDP